MNNYQDILDSYKVINNLSVIYSSERVICNYKDINLMYNKAGIPFIEMYIGDEIEITKRIFINAEEIYGEFENKLDFIINDENGNEGLQYTANTNLIKAINAGTYKINSNKFGLIDISKYNIMNVNDPDILVIVKEIPHLQEIYWTFDNPLLIQHNFSDKIEVTDLPIKLNGKYSDGLIKELKANFIYDNLEFISNNIPLGNVINSDDKNINPILRVFNYDDQLLLSIKLKESSKYSNVVLPNVIQIISYHDKKDIDIIKQAIYYIYYLSDNKSKFNMVTDKQYYLEKTTSKNFYVKVLNGYYDHGRFKILSNKNVSSFVNLESSSNKISINYDNVDDGFIITGNDEINNVSIKLINLFNDELPGLIDKEIIFDQISIVDSIIRFKWYMNDKLIVDTSTNVIDMNIGDFKVTDKHNIIKNKIIGITSSGSQLDITSSCIFSSTLETSNNINPDVEIEDCNFIVKNSNRCRLILNGNTKYTTPNLLDAPSKLIVNIIMSNETVYASNINIYEVNDKESILLNDTELDLKIFDKKQLYAVVYPEDATYKSITWSTDNTDMIQIDESGNLSIIGVGSGHIYCSIKYPDRDDMDSNGEYPDLYDPTTGEIINITFNPPELQAQLNINATKIDVTDIKFDRSSTTLYVDGDRQPYYIEVKPDGASIKDVKVKFENDSTKEFFGIDSNDEMYVYKEGTGRLVAYSVDNPDIKAEMSIVGIDTTVKKVTILKPGNDLDYEFYDDYFYSPETKYVNDAMKRDENKNQPVGRKTEVETEKYDDDDFARYYCPINNSIQLNASIEPISAIDTNLTWGSQQDFIKVIPDKGIFTPTKKTPIEMEYNNFSNPVKNGRYPNTWWVSVTNIKYGKGDVAQLRVFRNQITAINIGYGSIHDYDDDNFNKNGELIDENVEYNYDYVITRGQSIDVPVTLSVQDPSFGPSNYIYWYGKSLKGDLKWDEIIELKNNTINHKNATNDDFDWTSNTPTSINTDKKELLISINAKQLGSVEINADTRQPDKNGKIISNKNDKGQFIIPNNTLDPWNGLYYDFTEQTGAITDENGIAEINTESGIVYIKVSAYIVNYKVIDGNTLGNIYSGNYSYRLYTGYIALKDISIQRNASTCYIINVPVIIDEMGDAHYLNNQVYVDECYEMLNHISVTIGKTKEELINANPLRGTYSISDVISGEKFIISGIGQRNTVKQVLVESNEEGIATCPKTVDAMSSFNDNVSGSFLYIPRPSQGYLNEPAPSRKLKIRVIDYPSKIFVCPLSLKNIVNSNMPIYDFRSCWTKSDILKIKAGNKRYPFFIWFDEWFETSEERFTEILLESSCSDIDESNINKPVNIPLDDKYMSYAITSHDPNIVKIIERNDNDPMVPESFGNFKFKSNKNGKVTYNPIKIIDFNKLGYGRYFVLKPVSTGRTKISITNIMSGKTDIRIVEVVN